MKTYQYIYEPYLYKLDSEIKKDIISKTLDVLNYTDMESGELECLTTKLDNTQLFITNLIGILEEKNILTKEDWSKLIGQVGEK